MGLGGQRHAPAALPPGMTPYPLYRRLGRPQGRSGRVLKISPPPGFDPRTVQLVASRCTDWAIAAHNIYPVTQRNMFCNAWQFPRPIGLDARLFHTQIYSFKLITVIRYVTLSLFYPHQQHIQSQPTVCNPAVRPTTYGRLLTLLFCLRGEGHRSRCYGRTTALRLFV
jgi:hypothetical protein